MLIDTPQGKFIDLVKLVLITSWSSFTMDKDFLLPIMDLEPEPTPAMDPELEPMFAKNHLPVKSTTVELDPETPEKNCNAFFIVEIRSDIFLMASII